MKLLLCLSALVCPGTAYGVPDRRITSTASDASTEESSLSRPSGGSNNILPKETVTARSELRSALLSTERLPASSKLGKSLLSHARQLGYSSNSYSNNYNYNNNNKKSYDASWMANYDIVFHHCFNEVEDFSNVNQGETYVTFYLCSSEYACDPSTCAKTGAEYVVTLEYFLYYYMDLMNETCESSMDTCDYYCATEKTNSQNATYYGFDSYYYYSCQSDCLEAAGMSHCVPSTTSFAQGRRVRDRALSGSGDGGGEGGEGGEGEGDNDHQSGSQDGSGSGDGEDEEDVVEINDFGTMKEYYNCAKVAFNETNTQDDYYQGDHYMGPYCARDGKSVYFGLYTDKKCSARADKGTFEANSYGYSMPFSKASGSPVATHNKRTANSHCLSCVAVQDQDNYYEGQAAQAHADCSTLRTMAVAACESPLTTQLQTEGIDAVVTGCETVEEFNHVLKYGVTPKSLTFLQIALRGMVFGGVFLVPAVLLKAYARFAFDRSSKKYVLDGSSDTPYEQGQEGVMA
jgi:hypothetical protein